jgi:cytosine/adenosine deaminase-related metal-dependent hydrolase
LRQRNVLSGGGTTGRALFESAYHGGQQALGVADAGIAIGAPADLMSLATGLWEGDDGDGILNAWIFARGVEVDGVWVGGHQVVEDGRHLHRDEIAVNFRTTMRELLANL